jgi:AraC-like DNA-binding protein
MEEIYALRNGAADVPHRHDFYTILIVKEAEGVHQIDFKDYKLSDQQVFFISPGQVHQVIEEKASIGYSIVFSVDFLLENTIPLSFIDNLNLFNNYGDAPPLSVNQLEITQLLAYCDSIYNYYQTDNEYKNHAIGAFLKLILIYCNTACSLPKESSQIQGNTVLKSFKELVEQRYKEWHHTSSYAEALHISSDHLNRVVKSLIGKTAKEYIQSRITLAAKRLLHFSALSNKEIGYELGFKEPAHFSAFFKNCVGISPAAFKQKK